MGESPAKSTILKPSYNPGGIRALVWAWIPVMIGLCVIFIESSDMMSASNTGSILYGILVRIFGHHIDAVRFEGIHFFLRKSGHFLGYGFLGLLFFRAIRKTVSSLANSAVGETSRQRLFRWGCEAVLCTALVAAADELHQSFLPSRTGAVHDVVLDTTGAIVLLSVVLFRYALKPSIAEAQ